MMNSIAKDYFTEVNQNLAQHRPVQVGSDKIARMVTALKCLTQHFPEGLDSNCRLGTVFIGNQPKIGYQVQTSNESDKNLIISHLRDKNLLQQEDQSYKFLDIAYVAFTVKQMQGPFEVPPPEGPVYML